MHRISHSHSARPSRAAHALGVLAALAILPISAAEKAAKGPVLSKVEGPIKPFLGQPAFAEEEIFQGGRFPNLVVGTDGTVLASWGASALKVRRSEDGGKSWGPEIAVGKGIHGGGAIVDEKNGDILLFTHPQHPPKDGTAAPRTLYRSRDQGKSWQPEAAKFEKDGRGFLPSLHMSEHGLTLRHGPKAGRLIRPARVYQRSPERYSTTIYSDDGGKSWQAGEAVSIQGTGEGALLELSDGSLLYTARRSFFAEGQAMRHERHFARGNGIKWGKAELFKTLPDGPRYRGEKGRGANYNGHFGMLAGFIRLPVKDRDILIYSNADHEGHERKRLTVWASFDGGGSWPVKRLVQEGPSAYSSLAAGRPGTASEGWIYLQYEAGKGKKLYGGCRLARFKLSWLSAGRKTGDGSLPAWLK